MIPDIIAIPDRLPTEQLAADELLIVLGAPGKDRSPWVKELMLAAPAALKRSHHYLTCHAGVLPQGAPYLVVEWEKPGVNALERRWVAGKLGGLVAEQFNVSKLAVCLERGSGAEQLAIAEDILTRQMSPRYERLLLSGVRILSPEPELLQAHDPYFAVRLAAGLRFRSWVNEDPDSLTSLELGERLAQFCREHACTFESFDERRLAAMGMNLLVAVGQASSRSPSRLHIATHNWNKAGTEKPLLLVGKGITFDTGGINLKPHEGFVNCMKNDMGGAGLMINLFTALVESGYAGPIALAVPCCENLIAERAMKPGAIIRSYAGKDVIVEHTDAEGRLILADAIQYTNKTLAPALTITAATLTTASLRQFTNFYTAVHFASPSFEEALRTAGRAWGEEFAFWGEFLPFLQGNKSQAADLTNMGRLPSHASMGGGSNVAAHFLREFATTPLIHFDIFASTWNWSGDYPGAHYGATGAPFNSLFTTIRHAQGLWGY